MLWDFNIEKLFQRIFLDLAGYEKFARSFIDQTTGISEEPTYIDDLFFNYYHLHDNQLQVVNTIHSTGIDWTLGAMLYSLIKK